MHILRPIFFLAALFGAVTVSLAAEEGKGPAADAKLLERLQQMMPGVKPDSVSPSAIPGLSEVVIGPRVVYMTNDGRYLLQASIIDLDNEKNITEPRRQKAVSDAVDKVGEENMVVFGDKKAAHTVTVFTDIDCGYCRKLHKEMESYNKEGIRIRYLFYPRSGMHSPSYVKAVSVWCAPDRNKAMTTAKADGKVEPKDCTNPVADHMRLGEMIGVQGTPAMVLPGGEVLPGYVPADKLAQYLKQGEKKAD
ncbi:MAG: disulfide bond formation protein DsbC [Gammaproteobacteria bacterium RIFOXYA12_FULL_61_12]|nr:MAG: disulfide bond formation protein DsbC [Gammaproteobacteria bacterium RIFOXYD12_FULL_61_37]OGT92975.1 MAG: disulfide bond formation protein DsbC [Gammaproteobacteria bacterium RIFOXYA12_FULL_61_12]